MKSLTLLGIHLHTYIIEGDGDVMGDDLSNGESHAHHHQQLAVEGTHTGDQRITEDKTRFCTGKMLLQRADACVCVRGEKGVLKV